ncbi:MAG: alpha-amylase family glycosyl hydrolase, partial [Candidatus Cloacimonadota bacterium]|nr:alpha-amylase family glycosyl hydrolase [Candidatus Cloacimonadota bacterium]
MLKFPNSIFDQLNFIKEYWKEFIGDELLLLLQGIGFLKEENKAHFTGPGPAQIHEFNDEEYEKFTEDKDWMPHLILLAKSTYVWLDQLNKKYKIEVTRLDQIPLEELQLQASRGITGIWLIGIWQRSAASKRIKEINGDLDAIASAYSLDNYRIADDLGGEQALEELKRKAANVGIRIGCDMVPNHTGLDSEWIVEHPEWFLQLDHPPFPSYTFNGENLSQKNEIQVRIEDHYFEKTDAAIVFQYIKDGKNRYIYHGNDGTSTPWNDTAQLNYLLPEVRGAVSDKIIEIAKKFPIIRFDAAMTLAKKHVQRLWFPQPGSGGDIATRSEYGMSKVEFNKLFPNEFWREVVDRVAIEAPDTLLLAEAFWMMEGYFVRTLGMHRVYNSAFMNMLKDEENAKYRKSIFNILEFNPQILKRFVNFMSNPDEDTAIAQFGKDDKYFGVCLIMSTMPGLPMYAHGQIEGFTERYGMEFKKAKWQENEDEKLIKRHNREIFPLLNKRYLFSEVDNFVLFDFITEKGELNENVFAYTNKFEDQHSLVVCNNKFQQTSGWINWANIPIKKDEETVWIKKNLGAAWELHNDSEYFVIFKDEISDLEFIRNSREIHEKGLFQDLGAFKYAVFLNIYEVKDDKEKHYSKLAKYLQGGGVQSIQNSLKRIELLPLLEKFHTYYDWNVLSQLLQIATLRDFKEFKLELLSRVEDFLFILKKWLNSEIDITEISQQISDDLTFYYKNQANFDLSNEKKLFLFSWILMRHLGKLKSDEDHELISAEWLDELFFGDE